MAVTLHDHIHLLAYTGQTGLDATAQAATDYALLLPGFDAKPETAASVERGLTGVPHVYSTVDGSGHPLRFKNGTLQLLATQAELDALLALSGQRCYLVLNSHEDDDPTYGCPVNATNGYHCLAVVTTYRLIDPGQVYWTVFITITDLT